MMALGNFSGCLFAGAGFRRFPNSSGSLSPQSQTRKKLLKQIQVAFGQVFAKNENVTRETRKMKGR